MSIQTWSEFFVQLAGHHLWQAAVVAILLVALPARIKSWNAGTRYWLATMALAAILILPMTSMVPRPEIKEISGLGSTLSELIFRGRPAEPSGISSDTRNDDDESAAVSSGTFGPAARLNDAKDSAISAARLSRLPLIAFTIWAACAGWFLLGLGRQLHATARLIRDAHPASLPPEAVPSQASGFPILISDQVRSPLAVGLFRRFIVLPEELTDRLVVNDLRQVLAHEAAHLERRDTWFCLLQRTVVALCFFHPAVHWIARRMEFEQETSCDDRAAVTGDRRAYAACLLKVCESMQGPRAGIIAVGALTSRSQLTKRIRMMMDTTRNHQAEPSKKTLLGFTLATLSLVAVFSLTLPNFALADGGNRGRPGDADIDNGAATAAETNPNLALILAAWDGDLAGVERALAAGADPNGSQPSNSYPRSPLNAAARGGNVEIVRLLLDRGAAVDRVVRGDATPLMAAARHGHYQSAKLLLDRGADANRVLPGDGTALISAAAGGHTAIVELLLEYEADPNRAVSGDGAPMIAAARSGIGEIVDLLLDHGADADISVAGDGSSLIEAAARGNLAAVRRLVERGANVNKVVRGDGSPLIAAVRGADPEIVDYLLRNGADPDRAVSGDGSPLIEAARGGDQQIVSMLLEAGADIDQAVSGDGNPLIMASLSGHAEIVRALLQRGADPNSYVPGDETPLINASQTGHVDVARLLIEAGADVSLRVKAGSWNDPRRMRSPMSEAKRMGHDEMIRLLQSRGASD